MAKRFTDTEKWKKSFIKGLAPAYKLLWFYMLDECDHAGIWHKEMDVAQLRIGIEIDEQKAREVFADHIIEFDGGEKWFIPAFIEFQYGKLNPNNNAHKSAITRLKKYDLVDKDLTPSKSPSSAPKIGAQDKDKDKDKEEDMDKDEKEECEKEKQYTIHAADEWDGEPINHRSFVDYWNDVHDSQLHLTDNKRNDIKKQLKHFTGEQIKQAIGKRKVALADSKYLTSWESLFTRKTERMEKYLNLDIQTNGQTNQNQQTNTGEVSEYDRPAFEVSAN